MNGLDPWYDQDAAITYPGTDEDPVHKRAATAVKTTGVRREGMEPSPPKRTSNESRRQCQAIEIWTRRILPFSSNDTLTTHVIIWNRGGNRGAKPMSYTSAAPKGAVQT